MEFVCAELLGLDHEFNFWGNAFNYSNTQNFTIKGRLKNYDESITGIWTGMQNMITSSTGDLIPVIVNSINLGSGRLTSLVWDENTDVRLKYYTAGFTIERHAGTGFYNNTGIIPATGDFYKGSNNIVSHFTSRTGKYIKNFVEGSSFRLLGSGQYEYGKNVSFGIDEGIETEFATTAEAYARAFITAAKTSYGDTNILTAFYPNFYSNGSGILSTSQKYDIVNNVYEYNETFNFDTGRNYTWFYNHTFNVDGPIVTVSEDGKIQSAQLISYKSKAAETAWAFIETGIYDRVLDVYSDYTGIINYTGGCSLKNQPETTSLKKDGCIGTIEYSKSYSNNPFTQTGYSYSYSNSISLDDDGYLTVSEQGQLKAFSNIRPSGFNIVYSGYLSRLPEISGRIDSLYASSVGNFRRCDYSTTLKVVSTETTYEEFAGSVGYSKTFTENPSYGNGTFNKIKSTIKDDRPVHSVNYFPIPYGVVIPQKMTQSTRGTWVNTIELQGDNLSLNDYITGAWAQIQAPTGTDVYLKSYSYDYSPLENIFSMQLSYLYTQYRNGTNFLV